MKSTTCTPTLTLIAICVICSLLSCNQPQKPVKHLAKKFLKSVNKRWIGDWERDSEFDGGELNTNIYAQDSITFKLFVQSGGHTGEMEGKAYVKGNTAYFQNPDDKQCKVTFQLSGDSIVIGTTNCANAGGIGVTFDGSYVNSKVLSKSKKPTEGTMTTILTTEEDSIFRKLVGNSYQKFVSSSQLTNDGDNLDTELQAKVMSAGVRGLFTSMENIIMIDSSKHIWAAVIEDSNKVLYYTNDKGYANKLPKTIDNWRQNFKEYPVIYKSKD